MEPSSNLKERPAFHIPAPVTVADTGINKSLLEQLAVKILGLHGEMTLIALADRIGLSLPVVDVVFQTLRKEQLCEVKGMELGTYRIAASNAGKARAVELLAVNAYAGPAPVSLADYTARVREQRASKAIVRAAGLVRTFGNLVLRPEMFLRLGASLVSGTSLFLYGPTGTGKTTIANCIASVYSDTVWVPGAIEVDNQIITIYDSSVHERIEGNFREDFDRRWVPCRTPKVVAGGELLPVELDLQLNTTTHCYTAPLQTKANNGVLIVDDFGRQQFPPAALFNRWMTPLERGYDFLTLAGGKKFEVPFDLFVVFATNLNPADLADEAFLRRIPNKINVDYATPEQFSEIFRMECNARGLEFDPEMAEHLIQYLRHDMKKSLSHCYARDILNQIVWNAAYLGMEPEVSKPAIEAACRSYFLASTKPTE
jgi:energy-coupling factor transporter ATP-binding protein EcfA2